MKIRKLAQPSIGKSMRTLLLYLGVLCATYYLAYPFLEIMQGKAPLDSWKLLLHLFAILAGAVWFFRLLIDLFRTKRPLSDRFKSFWRGPGSWN